MGILASQIVCGASVPDCGLRSVPDCGLGAKMACRSVPFGRVIKVWAGARGWGWGWLGLGPRLAPAGTQEWFVVIPGINVVFGVCVYLGVWGKDLCVYKVLQSVSKCWRVDNLEVLKVLEKCL